MTVQLLSLAIVQLQVWMYDFKETGIKGSSDAVDKAELALTELGIKFSSKKKVDFREDPTLAGSTYVRAEFVRGFETIRNDFLKTYNAALKKRGRKPISLAA